MPNGRLGGGGAGGVQPQGAEHGGNGGGGGGPNRGSRFWSRPCTVCGLDDNFTSRQRCRNCGAYGPNGRPGGGGGGGQGVQRGGINRWNAGSNAGGGGGGGRQGGLSTATTVPPPTLAQRQMRQLHENSRAQQQRTEAKKREELLAQENARLRRQLAAQAGQPGAGGIDLGDDMEADDDQEMSDEERRKKIDDTRSGLAYLASKYGEESEELLEAKRDLAALERASREAKPYKTHRAQLEKRKERLTRQRERAQEESEDLQRQIDDLQVRLAENKQANEQREKEIQEVDSELKELLKKAIAEGEEGQGNPAQDAADPSTAWNTVSSALENMASQPGVPTEWAAQLGGLLHRLRAAALAIQQQAAATARAGTTTANVQAIGISGEQAAGQNSASTPQAHDTTTKPPSPTPAHGHQTSSPTQETTHNGSSAGSGTTLDVAQPKTPTAEGCGGQGASSGEQGSQGTCIAPNSTSNNKGLDNQRDSDLESQASDDDMDSVAGDDFDMREGETESDRKKRVRAQLREREKKRKQARRWQQSGKAKDGSAGSSTGSTCKVLGKGK